MKAFLQLAIIAAILAPVTAFAGTAPYENAVNKALHPGRGEMTRYAPRMYVQPRVYSQPSAAVAAAPSASSERRVFSYEPTRADAGMANEDRRAYSYEPQYFAPSRDYAPARHTYENATMKGLGQVR
jgi:hypothetical protein